MPFQYPPFIMSLLQRHGKMFLKFSTVGVLNTIIDFGVFALLYYILGWAVLAAHFAGFGVAVLNSFTCNALWTFGGLSRKDMLRQLIKFILVSTFGLLLSTIVLMSAKMFLPVWLAKVAAIGATVLFNYTGSWLFVFKNKAG